MSDHARLDAALVGMIRRARMPDVYRRLGAHAGIRLERAGYLVLSALTRLGPVRLTELAADLQLDASTASRHTCGLERAGLVRREPDPNDGRAHLLQVTAGGEAALARLQEGRRGVIEEATAGWTSAEREHLAELLERLSDGLDRVATAAEEPILAGQPG